MGAPRPPVEVQEHQKSFPCNTWFFSTQESAVQTASLLVQQFSAQRIRLTNIQTDRQTDRPRIDRQTNRQTNRDTDRQTDTQTHRQTNRHTDTQTDHATCDIKRPHLRTLRPQNTIYISSGHTLVIGRRRRCGGQAKDADSRLDGGRHVHCWSDSSDYSGRVKEERRLGCRRRMTTGLGADYKPHEIHQHVVKHAFLALTTQHLTH